MSDLFKQGAFSWAELATTDVEGAKQFYTALLGWTTELAPVEGMSHIPWRKSVKNGWPG